MEGTVVFSVELLLQHLCYEEVVGCVQLKLAHNVNCLLLLLQIRYLFFTNVF